MESAGCFGYPALVGNSSTCYSPTGEECGLVAHRPKRMAEVIVQVCEAGSRSPLIDTGGCSPRLRAGQRPLHAGIGRPRLRGRRHRHGARLVTRANVIGIDITADEARTVRTDRTSSGRCAAAT